jgi:hypothetical protein
LQELGGQRNFSAMVTLKVTGELTCCSCFLLEGSVCTFPRSWNQSILSFSVSASSFGSHLWLAAEFLCKNVITFSSDGLNDTLTFV